MDSLGIRPSQVMMSNCVVWVEGPSDCIYLHSLLRSRAPDLVFGQDYAFVTYGGSNINGLTFCDAEPAEAIVECLRIAPRSVVFADMDRPRGEVLKKAILRLLAEARENPACTPVLTEPCREIENLVSPNRLFIGLQEILGSLDPSIQDKLADVGCNIAKALHTNEKACRKFKRSKVRLARTLVRAAGSGDPFRSAEGDAIAHQLVKGITGTS